MYHRVQIYELFLRWKMPQNKNFAQTNRIKYNEQTLKIDKSTLLICLNFAE